MKKMSFLTVLVLLAVLLAVGGCATNSTSIRLNDDLKIVAIRIEPSSPKSEEEVYVVVVYEAPAGRELKASITGHVLVSKEMAGPYSREKTFEKQGIGTGVATEMRISLDKFHSSRGSLPVKLIIYLEDKDGGRTPTKTIYFQVG